MALGLAIGWGLLAAFPVAAALLDLEWTAPITNADNPPTQLTDLSGYRVYSTPSPGPAPCPGSTFQFVAAARPDPQPTDPPVTFQLTGLTVGTTYLVRVTAVDTSGNESICSIEASGVATNPPDTTPPTVSISAPATGASVRGTVTVSATASDNVGVVGVQFHLDGVPLGAEDITSPYSVSWNTTTASNGSHTLTAVARDAVGNTTTSTGVTVTVDNSAPTVSLTAPTAGATVSGTVTVSATATDNVGVVGVQFRLDGANLSAEDITSPYSVSWNTTTASNGSHTLTAVARDAVGNTTTSTGVTVTVSNGLNITTTSLPAATVGSAYSQTLSATGGITPYTWSISAGTLPTGLTLNANTGVISGTPTAAGTASFTVRVTDAATVFDDQPLSLTVNAPDTTPPTVSLTAPVNGATVAGSSVTVSATASDNVGVVGVQFHLDGVPLGAEDITSPYSVSWNTTTASNGSHTLTAVARDAAGNTTTSSPVTVTVANSTPPPLNITTTSLPAATVGSAYSQTLTATGGATPYTWSLASGTLPAGLSLNSSTGVISGTPITAGPTNFTVRVTDSAATTDDQPLSLTVNTPPPAPPASSSSGGGGGGGCFIATAAYGSALEPQVVLLRGFRDQYLVTNPLGYTFVQWYYHVSPPIAEAIRPSPTLRGLVRVALWPLIGLAWLSLHPFVGGAVLLGAGGFLTWGRARRHASGGRHRL